MSDVVATVSTRSDQPTTAWSRRAVLSGVAGAVLGAGVTEGIDRVTRHHPGPELHLASPGEELMIEHGVLKRVLLVYRAAADQLAAGHTPPAGAVADAAQIIADYVESLHEGLEEAYVFPRVQDQQPDLIRTLLIQHDRGRHLTAAIITTASGDLRPAGARNDLLTYLDRFVRMYEPHEAWEDTIVYPALRAISPQRTLDLLAERFAEEADRQIGDDALTQILDRVTGVEQQLGIADLNAATPPPLS
jgi:hemerythrin-like domain-containing protein